jgi:hypothetical protein
MNMSEVCCDEWISARMAASWLACPTSAVRRLARTGHITMRALPSCDPKFLASDVRRLARESTRPAVNREATIAATL